MSGNGLAPPQVIEEFNKGFFNMLLFGWEGYKMLPDGNIRCLTPQEISEEIDSGKPFKVIFNKDWW